MKIGFDVGRACVRVLDSQRRSNSVVSASLSCDARNSFGSSPRCRASRSSPSNRCFSARYAPRARSAAILEMVVFNGSRVIGSLSRACACAYCAELGARPSDERRTASFARACACAERSESRWHCVHGAPRPSTPTHPLTHNTPRGAQPFS